MISEFPSATIVFTGGPWAWAGAGLASLGAIWTVVGYRRRGGGLRNKALFPLLLRLAALALLAISLAEPAWMGEEAEPGANIVAVIADMPVEVARQSVPPSSDAMFSSSAWRVGLPLRV